MPELNRCRRVARGSSRAGSSPLILVGGGGRAERARSAATGPPSSRPVEGTRGGGARRRCYRQEGRGKSRRQVRYVCKEGGPRAQHCESSSGTSSPLLPIKGKPKGCVDKDREEKVCETTLRARGSQSPMFPVKGTLGPCKFTITRTSWRRFGTPGGYNGTVATKWTLRLVPKRVGDG